MLNAPVEDTAGLKGTDKNEKPMEKESHTEKENQEEASNDEPETYGLKVCMCVLYMLNYGTLIWLRKLLT